MKKISINRCTRSGAGRGRQDRRCTLFVLSTGWPWRKKWKLITSSLTPEPEEGSIVRLIGLNRAPPVYLFRVSFFYFFSFFFLPLPPPSSFLIFRIAFIYTNVHQSCFLFFWTHLMTRNERWLRCSLWRKRGGGLAISRTKFFFRCLPVEKGFISTSKAFRRFSGKVGWTRSGFLFSSKLGRELYFIRSFNATIMKLRSTVMRMINLLLTFVFFFCFFFSFFLSFFNYGPEAFFFWFLGEIKETKDVFSFDV